MSRPDDVVAHGNASDAPLYRCCVTGAVLPADEVDDCDRCCGEGEIPSPWGEVDCPRCDGSGKLSGFGIPVGANLLPRKVRRLSADEAAAHRSEAA